MILAGANKMDVPVTKEKVIYLKRFLNRVYIDSNKAQPSFLIPRNNARLIIQWAGIIKIKNRIYSLVLYWAVDFHQNAVKFIAVLPLRTWVGQYAWSTQDPSEASFYLPV